MARSVTSIYNSIISAINSNTTLVKLTSVSQVAVYRLFAFIVASAQAIQEQLYDQFISNAESIAAAAPVYTNNWIHKQALNFQYSLSAPQTLLLDTTGLFYYYPTVLPTLRIVTKCSVSNGILSSVNIKVAKGTTPATLAALTTPELTAFKTYFDIIHPAGLKYNITSTDGDRLYIEANIYIDASYSGSVLSDLNTAIDNFLYNLNFDGTLYVSHLQAAMINASVGILDVVLINVTARANATVYPAGTVLVASQTEVNRSYKMASGWIKQEDTASNIYNLI